MAFELPGVDVGEALRRMGGHEDALRRVLRQVPEQLGGVADEVRRAWQAGDPAAARRRIHAVLGVAGNLSAHTVVRWATALGRAFREGDEPAIGPALRGFEAALDELLAGCRALGAATAAGAGEGGDSDELAAAIEVLDRELARQSFDADQALDALRTRVPRGANVAVLDRLAAAVEQLDFALARRELATLAQLLGAGDAGESA